MNLRDISLNIYSFGYSAGFIKDNRNNNRHPDIALKDLPALAIDHGLGGIEFPFDVYFPPHKIKDGLMFIKEVQERSLDVAIDFEKFDISYIREVVPYLAQRGIKFFRVKMSGLYGGNRYKEPRFRSQINDFVSKIQSLTLLLKQTGVRLLIENHQDLGSYELLDIISRTSNELVGVNWDIGNSLAVTETPDFFLSNTAGYIGNIHLKDYQLVRSEKGFGLVRCSLGEGVVDFKNLLKSINLRYGKIPMSIELGAQNTRYADIFVKQYWEEYPSQTVLDKIDFFKLIWSSIDNRADWSTPWERGAPEKEISANEMIDLKKSVEFLRQIELNDET